MTAPARDEHGRPVNPDTNLPYPTASQAQLELAEKLLDRLDDDDTFELRHEDLGKIRDALVEVAVRQHGRTLRACLADLRDHAQLRDDNARYALGYMADAPAPVDGDALTRAYRSGIEAAALRSVVLRGDRA